jgi:4-hydroxy-tetrahydrodipicolinate reductase
MIKLIICGIGGRMGQRILALAKQDAAFKVVYGLETASFQGDMLDGVRVGSDLAAIKGADAVIDFTVAEASAKLVSEVAKYKKAYVIGTTGFNDAQRKVIATAAKKIPIVLAPNMSPGVNVFFKLAQEAARALPGYAAEIIEAHHVHKKDAPSGTALHAGGLIEQASGQKVNYQSIREGEIVGDHRVILTGPSERLELFHHAGSRDNFASGALTAAKWVVKKKPGLYGMKDVLGL